MTIAVHLTADERHAYRVYYDLFKSFEIEARRRLPRAEWA